MNERADRPYWNEQAELGLVYYGHAHRSLVARSHHEVERFAGHGRAELFQVAMGEGRRDYLQTHLLIPGNGVARDTRLADGQAWHYGADRTLVLWELIPERQLGVGDPRESLLYRTLWARYEHYLTQRFPAADTLLSTWEDAFDRAQWAGFLSALGYHTTAPAVFRKTLRSPRADTEP